MKSYRKYEERVCQYCGKTFSARADGPTKYCSMECSGKAFSKKNRKYAICPICGKEFRKRRSESKYCSNKCSAQGRTTKTAIKCDECGKEFERVNCHIRGQHNFCSRECQWKWHAKTNKRENHANWNGGIYHHDGYIFLKQEDGTYKAEHRIVMEEKLGRKLDPHEIVHHLDENKSNNSPENLVVMDRLEHAKLHHTKQKRSRRSWNLLAESG